MSARRCPKCGGDSTVIDTRERLNSDIRRRRKCLSCGYRWSTVERMEKDK